MSELRGIWTDAEQAGRHFAQHVRPFCHEQWKQGKRLAVHICEAEDERSVQQNRYYWGVVLKTISEQARIGGERYTADAWHELMKRQFLPRRVRKVKVAGRRRPVVTVSLGSTTDLSVKRMGEYLEKVTAFAATELGVTFPAMEEGAP